jgi:hypothetical protein
MIFTWLHSFLPHRKIVPACAITHFVNEHALQAADTFLLSKLRVDPPALLCILVRLQQTLELSYKRRTGAYPA